MVAAYFSHLEPTRCECSICFPEKVVLTDLKFRLPSSTNFPGTGKVVAVSLDARGTDQTSSHNTKVSGFGHNRSPLSGLHYSSESSVS